ncbi:hypothetical protein GUJ93_ZPchr0005g15334 [Zizania palustris]|uniref:WRKY domain-containing protein n=1 Tax=Zizania palustris TaxID=103762 RepID=A0A8J5S3K7_ZIZPA|nr:hypothetical protein GUJ93_ZPchr0005g15334 [Zizania palustris]
MKNRSFSYPAQSSSPCCATDGKRILLPCDHRPAIEEIVKEQSLVTQLRAVVLPALETKADERAELVAQLFGSILDCSRRVICALKSHCVGELIMPEADVGSKRRVKRTKNDDDVDDKNHKMKGEDDDAKGKTHEQKRSRRHTNSESHVTLVPHYDGHQWRKYGQKNINNSNHQRSYYRCTYKLEQNCKATKTVQQLDSSAGETMMYTVVYYGQHTCKSNNTASHDSLLHVVETSSSTPQSNLSTTTCSDPGDYGQTLGKNMHTPEPAGICSDDLGSHHTGLETDHQLDSTLGFASEDMRELLDMFDLEIWEDDDMMQL